MLVSSKKMLETARKNKYAIIQPDFLDSETAKALVEGAEMLDIPMILAWAPALEDIMSIDESYEIGNFYAKRVNVPICLHLDHGNSVEICKKAVDLGYTSVMIDASSDSFEENVRKTKEVVEYAHKYNIPVESELGHVGTNDSDESVSRDKNIYTEVSDAKKFVSLTNVDSLAVSIGTSHGTYKTGTPILNFERLEELKNNIDIPLVLHGGSSSGDSNLNKCAINGISKINIFTDFITAAYKISASGIPKSYLEQKKLEVEAIQKVLKHYTKVFETKSQK